jgi:hypothetical protein
LRGIVKRGRKYYLGVTTITQDVDDFLQTAYGKEIVTNSAIQILLKQHSAAIELIGKTFYLSEGEKQLLLSADKGEGIFFAGQNHVAIQVIASKEEHDLITSNPEDLLRKKIAQKQADLVKEKLPINEEEVNPPPTPPLEKGGERPDSTSSDVARPASVQQNKNFGVAKPEEQKPFVVEVEETPEQKLKKRIEEMEAQEKTEEAKPVSAPPLRDSDVARPASEMPKSQELFKAGTSTAKKPVFLINQQEEVKIPQPPQLVKKPVSAPPERGSDVARPEDKNKLTYEELFGNDKQV